MRDKPNRPNVRKIEFERITAKRIQELANKLDSTRPDIERTLAFCSATVRHYLGVEWLNRHVLPDSKHARYLRLDLNASMEEKQISIPRYLEFSESLLNLQDVEGFGFFLCRLMTEKVESCCAELDVARLLAVHELKFKFVPVQQKKGTDYDFEIFYPDGFMVHADAKCKFERTPVDLKSITNSLKKASKQFPKGEPAVVIVKVPAHWIRDVAVQRGIVSTAKEFLRDKERIVSIKFYATVPIVTNLHAVNTHIYSEVSNPNGLCPTRNWDMFRDFPPPNMGTGMPSWWIRFYPPPKGNR